MRADSRLRGNDELAGLEWRLGMGRSPGSKAADPVAAAMVKMLSPLPAELRRSVAFDNGSEFARHQRGVRGGHPDLLLRGKSTVAEKRSRECHRSARRLQPRWTDLKRVPASELVGIILAYNNTPRRCLGYRTPAAIFTANDALHL